MSLWSPPPPPATLLGRHRQLAPLAGIHVSPIQLGAMSIGDKWSAVGMGEMDKESSFKLLDAYYEAGGNFIDTANNYQDETSEEFIGEWVEKRRIREQLVIATKYSANFKRGAKDIQQKTHFVGNNMKSLYNSVEASLKKLRTEYIDILYVHWWDYSTSVEEVMNGLHHLVAQRKVLYLGISDTPAFIVSKANTYARLTGKTPFVIYQGLWNVFERDLERDILPMVITEGMALAPWNVLAGGKIRSDEEEERREKSGEGGRTIHGDWRRSPTEKLVCEALEKVRVEVNAKHITSVTIAYLMQKAPYVFPIVGGRKVEHLHANIEAFEISLSPEQITYLESIVPFEKGFPYNRFGDGSDYAVTFKAAGHFDKWPVQQAIRPNKQ